MTTSYSAIQSPVMTKGIEALGAMVLPAATSAGRYTVRFANTIEEVMAAQALRYRVFYDEKQGSPNEDMVSEQRDIDEWDDAGFHIIVLDTTISNKPTVVGTLRLLHSDCLSDQQGFYTEETFNLGKLKNNFTNALELSRFCIDPNARGGAILLLIWKYAMSFIQDNQVEVMLGCASFPGVDVNKHLPILNYLYEHHLAPEALRPEPKVDGYVNLVELYQPNAQWENAQKSIPTLLRGYLKLGAKISDAAIIDPVFNTVYVAIYVETSNMLKENPNLVTHV